MGQATEAFVFTGGQWIAPSGESTGVGLFASDGAGNAVFIYPTTLRLTGLPTSDPSIVGALYTDSNNVLYVSTGYFPSFDYSKPQNSMYLPW